METLEGRIVPTNLSGPITTNTFLSNTQVQNVVGNVDVEPGVTLTIQAGTLVQFNNGTSLTVDGTLLAQGTTGAPIDFTSVNDNSSTGGGNTAGPGNWGSIQFNSDSTGSQLTDASIAYGGSFGGPMVHDAGGPLAMNTVAISNSGGAGVRLEQSVATLNAVTFQNNNGAALSMDLDSNPTITGETMTSFTGNGTNGLLVDGGNLAESLTWNNPDTVYVLSSTVTVPGGMTLTVSAGQIIKSGGPALVVDGTLNAQGTAASPVIFTSLRDDASGGDTNNDGTSHAPGQGDWSTVQLDAGSTNNVLDHVQVLYAGSFAQPAIFDNGGPLALTSSLVSQSAGPGLRLQSDNATLTADTFSSNAGAAVSMDLDSNPTITDETMASFTGNGTNGLLVDGGNLAESLTWNNPDTVYVLNSTVTVPGGMTLTVSAGQIIKSGGPALVVDGTLNARGTAPAPVIFTSLRDDASGGDTNNDGTSHAPGRGDWSTVQLDAGSTNNVLDHVQVLYAGSFAQPAIFDNGGPLALTSSLVSQSAGPGLRLQSDNATLTADTFSSNAGAAVSMDLDSNPTITGETAASFTGNGTNGLLVDGGNLAESLTWNNPDTVYVLNSTVTVPGGMTLTVGAGQIIKSGGAALVVDGTLNAQGTAASPVTFTSLRDDASGGDTNNDGTASTPGPGDWGGLQLDATSSSNLLDHAQVLDAGSFGQPAILDKGGALALINSLVSQSGAAGLRIQSENAALTADTFSSNAGAAVSMDLDSNPTISGETVASFTGNGTNGVLVDGGTLVKSLTWNNPDTVYVLDSTVTVPSGMTLTVSAGQIVKAGGPALVVDGTLTVQGTAASPVIFTSLKDDASGGDTNNDGSTSTPSPGDWGLQLDADSTSNVLDHLRVLDAGSFGQPEILDNGGPLALTNSLVSQSAASGLRVVNDNATLTADTFTNNAGIAVSTDLNSSLSVSDETAASFTGNGTNGVVLDSGTLTANLTLTGLNVNYSLGGTVAIAQGLSLNIAAAATFVGGTSGDFTGTGTIAIAGTFLMATAPSGSMNVNPELVNTGTVAVQSGTLNLIDGLVTNGQGILTVNPGATLEVAGNLGGSTQNAVQFTPGAVNLDGSGTATAPQTLEVMSQDLGNTAAGVENNFFYASLALSGSTYVRLVDLVHNSPGTGAEALYVGNLSVPGGSTLDLNGLHVYAHTTSIQGTILNGTIVTPAYLDLPVTSTADSGPGSLRQEILSANSGQGPQVITFDLPGMGVPTFFLLSPLPALSVPVVIDGTSRPGFAGTPVIVLDGSMAGATADGLQLAATASASTIEGLVIDNFPGAGIDDEASDVQITGNWVGLDATGAMPEPDGVGILITGSGNTVGGSTAAEQNVIAGNTGAGIEAAGSGATDNLIQGNAIGTDATGTVALGNGGDGVLLTDASDNTIEGNTIANNADDGVKVDGGTGDSILTNSLFSDARLEIELTGGGNDNQPPPVLTGVTFSDTGTTITGTIQAAPNTSYVIQFFSSPATTLLGFGEARTFLDQTTVTTDASGSAAVDDTIALVVPADELVSATATVLLADLTPDLQLVGTPAPVTVGRTGNTSVISNAANPNHLAQTLPGVSISASPLVVTASASATETVTFTVTLTTPSEQTVIVPFTTVGYTTAPGPLDFIPPDSGRPVVRTFAVTIAPEAADAAIQTFAVNLGQPTNAILDTGSAAATIVIYPNSTSTPTPTPAPPPPPPTPTPTSTPPTPTPTPTPTSTPTPAPPPTPTPTPTPAPTPTPSFTTGKLINSGKGKKKTFQDQLFFSAPLDAASAQSIGDYQITQRITKKKTAKVRVLSATYSAGNNSVTLTLGKPTPGKALLVMVTGLRGAGGTPVGTFVTGL